MTTQAQTNMAVLAHRADMLVGRQRRQYKTRRQAQIEQLQSEYRAWRELADLRRGEHRA